jgi:hypothetical protein
MRVGGRFGSRAPYAAGCWVHLQALVPVNYNGLDLSIEQDRPRKLSPLLLADPHPALSRRERGNRSPERPV